MKVSILMNGYNCEKYVAEAIDSVFSQTYDNWEIVFVDNCSVDKTSKIVHSYQDDRIKYFKTKENIPLGAARKLGLEHCTGEFICFLDTDDLWLSHKLELQLGLFDKEPSLKMVYTGVYFIDGFGNSIGSYTPKADNKDVFKRQLVRYEINQQSVMIRHDFNFSFDQTKKYSVDYCLFMSICAKYKVKRIQEKLVKYRLHDSNFSHTASELEWIEQKDALDQIFNTTPGLKAKYLREYNLAYARVYYYKARHLMSKGEAANARSALRKYAMSSGFYFGLFVLSMLPAFVWNSIHKKLRTFS